MEQEYKWVIPRETLAALAGYLRENGTRLSQNTLHMQAVYYDTVQDDCYRTGSALRMRRENDRSVCCMKRTIHKEGALAEREEYETEAETLEEGLEQLPAAGAPADFCLYLRHQQFKELGRTDFIRSCYLLEVGDFTAEFAVDIGSLGKPPHMVRFEEIELELKSGSGDAFRAFAEGLQQQFALQPQPLSKLARAVRASSEMQQ